METANEVKPQIVRTYLINLYALLNQIDLTKANIKTAYWVNKNVRILSGEANGYEALRKELTNSPVFKKYVEEFNSMSFTENMSEDERQVIQSNKDKITEKYKEVIEDADKELTEYVETKVDAPKFYMIKIDDVVGIDPQHISVLYDLIVSE